MRTGMDIACYLYLFTRHKDSNGVVKYMHMESDSDNKHITLHSNEF